MNYFLIDAGNTHIKVIQYPLYDTAEAENARLLDLLNLDEMITLSNYTSLIAWLKPLIEDHQLTRLYISWVRSPQEWQQLALYIGTITCIELIDVATLKTPISQICQFYSAYDLQQLGVDRWLQMLGAAHIYPHQPFVLWQAGTAQTIDWIGGDTLSDNIHHHQGWIILGITTYLKALHEYTGQLPYITTEEIIGSLPESNSATTTYTAITIGLSNYLKGLIMRVYQQSPSCLNWVITGGDRKIMMQMIQNLQQSGELSAALSIKVVDAPLALCGLVHAAHHHIHQKT